MNGAGAVASLAPPFAYYGGKTTLARRIAAVLPPHQHYVEPFAGSLAVLLAKQPSTHETVNDLDDDIVTFWRVLRDHPDDLARVCALTPHSRSEYKAARIRPSDLSDIERARRVWVALTQGRAGRLTNTGWRRYVDPGDSSASMPDYLAAYVDRMRGAAARLARVSIECRPALDLIARYGAHEHVTLYVDPPYLAEVRSWGNQYRHELRTRAEHVELAEALLRCRAAVVLSGYSSALYDELYAGWRSVSLPAFSGNARAGEGARVETLWLNRPADGVLFHLDVPAGAS